MSWGSLWQHEQPRLKGLEGIKESFIFQIENRSMLHSPPNLSVHSSIRQVLSKPPSCARHVLWYLKYASECDVVHSGSETSVSVPTTSDQFLIYLAKDTGRRLTRWGMSWGCFALVPVPLCSIPLPWHLLSRWGSSWVEKVVWFSLYHFSLVLGPILSSFWKNLYSQSLLFYAMSSTPVACQTNLVSCSKTPVLFRNLPLFSSDGLWHAWISFFL